jgi:hypothetical protein
MAEITFAEFLVHLATFLMILAPLPMIWRIYGKSKGKFVKPLIGLGLGFLPMALFHLFEAVRYFGIDIIPGEGTFANLAMDHIVQIIAFVAFTGFLLWFSNTFIEPFFRQPIKRAR